MTTKKQAEPRQRPVWESDTNKKECTLCGLPFNVTRRRHHCRNCGKIFCVQCANHFLPLEELEYDDPVRVCRSCLQGMISASEDQPISVVQNSEEKDPSDDEADAQGSYTPIPFEHTSPLHHILEDTEAPPDFSPDSKPNWDDVKHEISSAHTLRMEDPNQLFCNLKKLAEGGQGKVYYAQLRIEKPVAQSSSSFKKMSSTGTDESTGGSPPTSPTSPSPEKTNQLKVTTRKIAKSISSKFGMGKQLDAAFFTPTPTKETANKTSQLREVAIKKIKFSNMGKIEFLQTEIAMTKLANHPNVIEYVDTFVSGSELWMVMEFMPGGSLASVLERLHRLNEPDIAYVCKSMLSALAYIHSKHRMHRDIKSDNVLLGLKGEVKLSDFGFATQLTQQEEQRKSVIGTPFWMAPEVIKGKPYGTEADIWSVGITTIEMVDGLPPYISDTVVRAMYLISSRTPPKPQKPHSSQLADFVHRCLGKAPTTPGDRWTAAELLDHNFLKCASTPEQFAANIAKS